MRAARGKTYRPGNPERSRHAAHSPAAKWPADDLGFFLLDTVPRLALRRFEAASEAAPRGAPPFAPQMRGCLLLEASGVGVFASRQMARACERPLAFLASGGAAHAK